MNTTSTNQRRSLRGALRNILLRCRGQVPDDTSSNIGSGILRREPSLPVVNNESARAFLLGLESTCNDEYDSNDIPDRFDISSLATSAAMSSTYTFTIQPSLSQFDIYNPPLQETRYLRRGRCDSVASSLAEGASYQASLRTLSSFRSGSTLKIQSSSHTLRSDSDVSSPQLSFPERIVHNLPHPNTNFFCPSPPRSNSLSPKRSLRKRASIGSISSPSPLRQLTQPNFDLNPIDHLYQIPYDYTSRFSRPLSVIEEVASNTGGPPTPRHSPLPHFREMSRSPTPLGRTASINSERTNSLLSVKHFSSFCALDTATPGCPVTATSTDLKYIFEIGENFCLNNQGCDDISIDILTGSDALGNSITHVVIFSPLVIPHSGRSRFTLSSLIDVTDFIHDTASLPELEMISEESCASDPPTPRHGPQSMPKAPKYQLSAESLLGGCFMEDPRTPIQKYDEDIWVNLATEERKQHSQKTRSDSTSPVSATSMLSSVEDLLDDFMCRLQELHSDFFLLAKSPLDDNYYEICNVSPRVYENRDYVNGHLSKTSVTDMSKLSSLLAGDEQFDMEVRWGVEGVSKHLYCIPLFARNAVTWICFLVDPGLPILW